MPPDPPKKRRPREPPSYGPECPDGLVPRHTVVAQPCEHDGAGAVDPVQAVHEQVLPRAAAVHERVDAGHSGPHAVRIQVVAMPPERVAVVHRVVVRAGPAPTPAQVQCRGVACGAGAVRSGCGTRGDDARREQPQCVHVVVHVVCCWHCSEFPSVIESAEDHEFHHFLTRRDCRTLPLLS